jgi:hypothetical protein
VYNTNIYIFLGIPMKKVTISRNSEIDLERCVDLTPGGRYHLVIEAAQRMRELKRQHREGGRYITAIDALKEVQEGSPAIVNYRA